MMPPYELAPCETWDSELPSIPPRSYLFTVVPIGWGQPTVESLTSYIVRLADAHCISVGKLIKHIIGPVLRDGLHQVVNNKWYVNSELINGLGCWAQDWANAAGELTGYAELTRLTMTPWVNVLAPNQLVRKLRTWCPQCLSTWREQGMIIYEPLLWTLKAVTLCARHQRPLQFRCPNKTCGRASPWLTALSRIGHCSHCQTWLGQSIRDSLDIGGKRCERNYQDEWTIRAIEELLTYTLAPPTSAAFSELIANYRERQRELCSLMPQIDRAGIYRTFRDWAKGTKPSLASLLNTIRLLRVSPKKFLQLEDADPIPVMFMVQLTPARKPRKRRKNLTASDKRELRRATEAILAKEEHTIIGLKNVEHKLGVTNDTLRRCLPDLASAIVRKSAQKRKAKLAIERRKIELVLDAELASPTDPPRSVSEIARSVNKDPCSIREKFPDKSKALALRYKGYLHSRAAERKQRIKSEVRRAVFHLHNQGLYPSVRRVTSIIGRLYNPLDAIAVNARHEALSELGWEQ